MKKKEHTSRSRQYGGLRFLFRSLLKSCIVLLSVWSILYFGSWLYHSPEVQQLRDYAHSSIPASKESDMIAFSCYHRGGGSLYTIYPDGSHLRLLRQNHPWGYHYDALEWSPDGIWIASISQRATQGWRYLHLSNDEIHRIRFDGANFKRLTYTPFDENNVQWSHNGKSILFNNLIGLYQMSANGHDIKQLNDFRFRAYDLSPDGSSLALVDRKITDENSAIYRMNPDGSGLQLLTDVNRPLDRIEWAPDNERLIYYHGYNWHLDYLHLDYSGLYVFNVKTLVNDFTVTMKVRAASWSPNGRWIAIVVREASDYANGEKFNNLYLFDANTGAIREVVKNVGGISWSPDSAWIAFSQDEQLFKIKWDGTALQQLTNLECRVWDLSWSPK